MEKNENFCIVYCNCESGENAKIIANELVSDKLAACVSILSGTLSVFEWKGKVESRQEFTLMIKTRKELFDKIEEKIIELHLDSVPEIISLKIDKLHLPYANWMDEELK